MFIHVTPTDCFILHKLWASVQRPAPTVCVEVSLYLFSPLLHMFIKLSIFSLQLRLTFDTGHERPTVRSPSQIAAVLRSIIRSEDQSGKLSLSSNLTGRWLEKLLCFLVWTCHNEKHLSGFSHFILRGVINGHRPKRPLLDRPQHKLTHISLAVLGPILSIVTTSSLYSLTTD